MGDRVEVGDGLTVFSLGHGERSERVMDLSTLSPDEMNKSGPRIMHFPHRESEDGPFPFTLSHGGRPTPAHVHDEPQHH